MEDGGFEVIVAIGNEGMILASTYFLVQEIYNLTKMFAPANFIGRWISAQKTKWDWHLFVF